ncbi:MAG: exodeoxyribonuclease VII large subunit [Verrucomicrobiota bacterium]
MTSPKRNPELFPAARARASDEPPAAGLPQDRRKIYRVSEITRLIRIALENEFGTVWVEGELSNVRRPASGHLYFTLKDESAQLSAVLFRGDQQGLKLDLKDGLKVRVFGQISVYEAGGQYQVIVRKVEEAGKGSLQEAFEALKKKLAEEGLFDPARKKPIPLLPQHVGLVTSPTGAAIRDILKILSRRFPNLHLLIAPVRVQGEGAAQEIAAAIDLLNQRGGLDVMIVGRGGGSLEDLWCFNEEVVARAIARSRIPVISAVGHEIDFTISDFVADLRAPTPSAAAEVVVGRKQAFEDGLREMSRRLVQALRHQVLEIRNRLVAASRSYVFREPRNLVRQYAQRIDALRITMTHEARGLCQRHQLTLDEMVLRRAHRVEMIQKECRQDVRLLASQLRALSPAAVLDRGYSITRTADGEIVRDVDAVEVGEQMQTQLARGAIESKVLSKKAGGPHAGKAGG